MQRSLPHPVDVDCNLEIINTIVGSNPDPDQSGAVLMIPLALHQSWHHPSGRRLVQVVCSALALNSIRCQWGRHLRILAAVLLEGTRSPACWSICHLHRHGCV